MPFHTQDTHPASLTAHLAKRTQADFSTSETQEGVHFGIDLNQLMISNPPATYLLRTKGDAMLDAGIREDDILVADFSLQPEDGDIVIARLDDRFAVRRFCQHGNAVQLRAENSAANYPPIMPQAGQTLEVTGVVRWVIHHC